MTDHFDPTPDEDDLLAVSALLDGTASAEEIARVESDPALRALLDDLRGVRTELADVPPAPSDARDAAVASALAVFDELHGAVRETGDDTVQPVVAPALPGSTPGSTNVIRFERRRRWYGVMTGAAAAAVAVLFVGALVVGGGGDDEESSTALPEAAKVDARTAADATVAGAPTAGAPEAATEMAADDAEVFGSGGGADTEAAPEATEAPAATEAATETTAAAAGGTIAVLNGPAEVVTISTPEQLRDYARSRQAILPLPGLGLPCVADGTEAVGEVTYQGVLAIVVRDPASGTVTAYDTQDACAVLVTVEP